MPIEPVPARHRWSPCSVPPRIRPEGLRSWAIVIGLPPPRHREVEHICWFGGNLACARASRYRTSWITGCDRSWCWIRNSHLQSL
ncbi:hypothetical protein HBB16_00695 [Pseudonocardia sp. MCCB 268]|nr:hypothetical protein [Pseudonocardia cytotoxica]